MYGNLVISLIKRMKGGTVNYLEVTVKNGGNYERQFEKPFN